MKTPSYKKISTGEMQGWLREDILSFLPSFFFEDPIRFIDSAGGRVIGESKWRRSTLFSLSNGKGLFFKMDRTKGWAESLKYLLFPSRGRKEWFVAYQMKKRNLPVPGPLGWFERVRRGLVLESYYLSEAIESGISLGERLDLLGDEKIFSGLAKTVIRVHQSGLYHRDFHAGNFLWDGESFFLTDLHRARIMNSLSLKQKLWSLAHLFHSLRSIWGREDQIKFLQTYFDGEPAHFENRMDYLNKILLWMDRLQKRQWRSRTKRCLKESTEFSVKKEKGLTFYHRKDFPLDRLKRAAKKHLAIVQETPSLLVKQSSEVIVSIFNDGENRICVKQFCYPHWWDRFREHFHLSKGLKAWLGGNGLKARGVSSIKPLALMERKSWFNFVEGFLVMDASEPGEEMDRYLCKGFSGFEEKRIFIKSFALWLSQLHQRNIYHQDMKACNILVSENQQAWDFKLLDLEDVRLNEKVGDKRLFKNLLQLNTSIPSLITRTDRLRFFKAYLKQHPIIRNEEEFLFRLIKKSKERGIIYVSPYGVVKEGANPRHTVLIRKSWFKG